jgi:hypothetical protein
MRRRKMMEKYLMLMSLFVIVDSTKRLHIMLPRRSISYRRSSPFFMQVRLRGASAAALSTSGKASRR